MTAAEALRDIQGFAAARRIRVEAHARQRMRERGATFLDVENALMHAERCTLQENGRWRVEGPDLDGEEMTLIVVIEGGVVVITVF